jgi:hypothetical protein
MVILPNFVVLVTCTSIMLVLSDFSVVVVRLIMSKHFSAHGGIRAQL